MDRPMGVVVVFAAFGRPEGGTTATFRREAPLGLATAVLVATWIPSARAKFGIIDDHEIIRMLAGRSRLPIAEAPRQVLDHSTEQMGRFRPLYWVGQVVESAWAGDNPALWYLDRLLLAVLTLAALYLIARHYCSPGWSGALALGVLLGPQFEIWSRLGAAETYAMPLFAVGGLLMQRGVARQDRRTVLAATAVLIGSGLAKEAFLPFAVAALLYVALTLRRDASNRDWLAAGLLVLVLAVDVAVLLVQLIRFGDQYAQTRTPATAASWAGFALSNAMVFQALGIALLIGLATGRHRACSGRAVALAIIGLASQVAFYAGADHVGRYLLPGAVAFMVCWIPALRGSRRTPRVVMAAAGCALFLGLVLGAISSFHIAQTNSESTRQFQSWLQGLEAQLAGRQRPTTVVIQPVDPYLDYERVLSIAEYLRIETPVEVMTARPTMSGDDERSRRIARAMSALSSEGTKNGMIEPLSRPARCMSILLGDVRPICSSSVALP